MNYQDDFKVTIDDTENRMGQIQLEMRLGFVRKVYGILSVQLLITTIFTLFSMYWTSWKHFQMNHIGLAWIMIALTFILPIIIICCPGPMRQVPQNYIVLFLFTFAESYLVSFICAMSKPQLVFMAAFMTFCLVVSLTIYALTTKTDFTMQGGLLFIFGCAFGLFSLFGLFTNNRIFHIILCAGGIILFGLYLIYDTQLILGKQGESLDIDDYILGSFMLYTDIVYIFMRILELLQLIQGGNN